MNISYNPLTFSTGTWTKTPTAAYQYKKISSNIRLNNGDTVITFNNLPVGMTVANSPTRTDPADRALGRCIINLAYPELPLPHGLSFDSFPFQSNLQIHVDRINCISGSRNLYQNYLAPVAISSINTFGSPLYEPVNLDSPYDNISNISGCIMYEYVNAVMSGSIFLTGNGTGYLNTDYNSFIFSENRGPYIADYTNLTMNFKSGVYFAEQMDVDPSEVGIPSEFLPDEILSSYTKLSDNSIKVGYNLEGVSSSLSRLHVLFNRP